MSENPYTPPPARDNATAELDQTPPSLLRSVMWSTVLASGCGILGFVIGNQLGWRAYPYAPAYFNELVYPNFGFGESYSEKARVQTGIRFALRGGTGMFCLALAIPLLKYVKDRLRFSRR